MLATRGLGRPGGLLVAGGLGRGVYVPLEWLTDLAPYEVTSNDPHSFVFRDLRCELHEDSIATLAYDRGPVSMRDLTLTARDAYTFSESETVELQLDHLPEVTR